MTNRPTCETCHYWVKEAVIGSDPDNGGHCHIRSLPEWPWRASFDWCGEHKPGPAKGKRYIKNDGECGEAWDAVGVYGGNVYYDAECTVAHANPIIADANGVWPPIYVNPEEVK